MEALRVKNTGLALAGSNYLLILSDPDKADPSGRKFNAIAEAFREIVVPRKPAGQVDTGQGKAAESDGKKQ